MPSKPEYSFSNTEIAFAHKTNEELKRAQWLFSTFNYRWLLSAGPTLAKIGFSTGLPIKRLIKNTLFAQFCGGESIEDCAETIDRLASGHIGTILDYSLEGAEEESSFDHTAEEIIRTINKSAALPDKIPFAVFKVTGIGRFSLLEKAGKGEEHLAGDDAAEYQRLLSRFNRIIEKAAEKKVCIFVDAEETWIQEAIDRMTERAMARYNREEVIVYNTLQMYRHDRLEYLRKQWETAQSEGYKLGFKIVRGAYMEKERLRAYKMNYRNPIQPDKASSDRDYNAALAFCVERIKDISICAGTHNEHSCEYLTQLMFEQGLAASDKRIYFAQLLGMSDHISYNLANAGYRVAKYVPYSPVKDMLPYLVRRAQENSSVKGQAGRELALIEKELRRRQQR